MIPWGTVFTQKDRWREVTWHEYISPNAYPLISTEVTRQEYISYIFLHSKKNGRKLLDMNIFPLPPIAPLLFSSHHFRELRQQESNNVIKTTTTTTTTSTYILPFLTSKTNALNQPWKPFFVSSKNITSKIISLLSIQPSLMNLWTLFSCFSRSSFVWLEWTPFSVYSWSSLLHISCFHLYLFFVWDGVNPV